MDKSDPNDLMVWVDLETTGLDYLSDQILEVGVAVTDLEGNNLEGFSSLVLNSPRKAKKDCDQVVQDMHDKSGLWAALDEAKGAYPALNHVQVVEKMVIEFLTSRGLEPGVHEMTGNSVQFDRMFLLEHMPNLHDWFHYRNLDVTSIKNACRRLNPSVYAGLFEGKKLHRVMPDIADSIAEYQFYMDNFLLVSLPVSER